MGKSAALNLYSSLRALLDLSQPPRGANNTVAACGCVCVLCASQANGDIAFCLCH